LIRKIHGNDAWHNFYLTPTIKIGTINKYKFRISDHLIWIGGSTEKLFGTVGVPAWKDLETVSVYFGGDVHARASYYNLFQPLPKNSIVEMTVDTIKWTVTWMLNNDRIISETIHESMRSKSIYVQITILNTGSSV